LTEKPLADRNNVFIMMLRRTPSFADPQARRRFCNITALIGLCAVAIYAAPARAATSAVTVVPIPPVSHLHTTPSLVKNPHLKGIEHPGERLKRPDHKDIHDHDRDDHLHHTWHRRWDYVSWIALHRGLGTIRGFVHGPSGSPVAAVHVVLRKPGGRIFVHASRRHVTYTDASGNFVMFGVRVGRYRVVAVRAKMRGHSQVAVHPGTMANVSVKI